MLNVQKERSKSDTTGLLPDIQLSRSARPGLQNLAGNFMGRTVPSFRMLLEGIVEELSAFRRALRGEDRDAFDSIMNMARQHASSCTVAPLLDPMDAVFLSILIEQQKEIRALRASADGSSGNMDVLCKIKEQPKDTISRESLLSFQSTPILILFL